MVVTTVLGGLANTSSLIGFGFNAPGVLIVGGNITLVPSLLQTAFSMPRAGTITSVSVYFSNALALNLIGTTVNLTFQLYQSTTPSDVFTPIPGTAVTFPLTGAIAIGAPGFNATLPVANFAVTNQTRILLVASSTVFSGLDIATVVSGNVSAGVAIQ